MSSQDTIPGQARQIAIRDTATGHRIWDARTRRDPIQTRHLPIWIWPLEIAARWRAKTEGRWG
jgi:hypothetical protein